MLSPSSPLPSSSEDPPPPFCVVRGTDVAFLSDAMQTHCGEAYPRAATAQCRMGSDCASKSVLCTTTTAAETTTTIPAGSTFTATADTQSSPCFVAVSGSSREACGATGTARLAMVTETPSSSASSPSSTANSVAIAGDLVDLLSPAFMHLSLSGASWHDVSNAAAEEKTDIDCLHLNPAGRPVSCLAAAGGAPPPSHDDDASPGSIFQRAEVPYQVRPPRDGGSKSSSHDASYGSVCLLPISPSATHATSPSSPSSLLGRFVFEGDAESNATAAQSRTASHLVCYTNSSGSPTTARSSSLLSPCSPGNSSSSLSPSSLPSGAASPHLSPLSIERAVSVSCGRFVVPTSRRRALTEIGGEWWKDGCSSSLTECSRGDGNSSSGVRAGSADVHEGENDAGNAAAHHGDIFSSVPMTSSLVGDSTSSPSWWCSAVSLYREPSSSTAMTLMHSSPLLAASEAILEAGRGSARPSALFDLLGEEVLRRNVVATWRACLRQQQRFGGWAGTGVRLPRMSKLHRGVSAAVFACLSRQQRTVGGVRQQRRARLNRHHQQHMHRTAGNVHHHHHHHRSCKLHKTALASRHSSGVCGSREQQDDDVEDVPRQSAWGPLLLSTPSGVDGAATPPPHGLTPSHALEDAGMEEAVRSSDQRSVLASPSFWIHCGEDGVDDDTRVSIGRRTGFGIVVSSSSSSSSSSPSSLHDDGENGSFYGVLQASAVGFGDGESIGFRGVMGDDNGEEAHGGMREGRMSCRGDHVSFGEERGRAFLVGGANSSSNDSAGAKHQEDVGNSLTTYSLDSMTNSNSRTAAATATGSTTISLRSDGASGHAGDERSLIASSLPITALMFAPMASEFAAKTASGVDISSSVGLDGATTGRVQAGEGNVLMPPSTSPSMATEVSKSRENAAVLVTADTSALPYVGGMSGLSQFFDIDIDK